MKKTNLFLTCAIASCALITSCKDDAEEVYLDESGQVKETSPGKINSTASFALLSPEENKKNIEDDGLALLSNIEDLSDAPAIDASASFVSFLDRASAAPANGRLSASSRTLAALGSGNASANDVFSAMKTADSEAGSIQEFYDQYTGVWSWNADKEEWDYSSEGDLIVFNFPATEIGTKNNAQFTIHSYEGLSQDHPFAGYEGDLPTKLKTELTVEGEVQAAYSFVAAYNKNGEPSQLNTSLSVNSFVFSIIADNSTEAAGVKYSLKRDTKTLLGLGAGAYGNFSSNHLMTLDDQAHSGDVVNRVDAYFQLMNVVLAGDIDIKKYLDGVGDNYQEGYYNSEPYEYKSGYHVDSVTEENAQLLESCFNLHVSYADGSGKIADTEVYTYTDTETYYHNYYDEDKGKYVNEKEEKEYLAMDVRMVFEDESKSDLETYFSAGFEDLVKEFEAFAKKMEEGL